MLKIGWFSTGRDKAARDLLTAAINSIKQGEVVAEIAFVFCNREPGESKETDLFLKLVRDYQLPLIYCSEHRFKASQRPIITAQPLSQSQSRLDYDREVMTRLAKFSPDLCVLAGYMLIVGREMCQRYNMINLHPAAPGGPAGSWQEVIGQLIDNGAKETGVMMHLVTPQLDKGPPLAYCTFAIRGQPFDRYWQLIETLPANSPEWHDTRKALCQLIRSYGLAREFPLIIATLKAFSQGKIKITEEKQAVDDEGRPIRGYNLTDEIDKIVKNLNPTVEN